MAKRLGIKHRKCRRDQHRAYEAGMAPAPSKTSIKLSRKAKLKKAYRMV